MNIQNQRDSSTDNTDIYFDYIYNQGQETIQEIKVSYPIIFFMYSGKLIIKYKKRKISVEKGECVFLQADTTVSFQTKDCDDESFCGIYIGFNQSFLYEFYSKYYNKRVTPEKNRNSTDIMKTPCTPYMQSLYISMLPYFEQKTKPTKNVMELKRLECVYCMLTSDPQFYSSLFDFIKPIELNLFYVLNKNNLN